jgi:hypothetical protein
MSSEQYFSKFPTISYNGTVMRDISRRVKLSNQLRRIPTVFYPYQLEHDTRADVLAYQYYGDASLHWLVYLTNGIVDPYYGWLLTDSQLSDHIIEKYGSLSDAQRRISHWATNWYQSDTSVSVSYYNNNIPEQIKKYYVPNYGPGTRILSYKRRAEDWIIETNRIVTITLSTPIAAGSFVRGSLLNTSDTVNGFVLGSAEVIASADSTITIKDVLGDWSPSRIVSLHSDPLVHGVIVSTKLIAQPLSDLESVYWEPVYCYNAEVDVNAKNGTMLLLDKNYQLDAGEQLTKTLQAD